MKKTLFTLVFCLPILLVAQGTQLLRQPTISNTEVAFVYANDIWKAPLNGGEAIRLTSDDGYESNPHFSKDGNYIAFTAQYDGNVDVYVMPSDGGEPMRLTFHPDGDFVQGWTPDNRILFRSGREGQPTKTNKLYTVSMNGGLPESIGLDRAAYGELSNDGTHLAYTPITSWDPEWRNYRGGQAMPIWIVDLKTKELITTPQLDKERHLDPVWFKEKVYYLSERDYTSNIWSFDVKTKEEKQITFHKKFDVKSLNAGASQLVFEQGGYLHLLQPQTGVTKQLNITVNSDVTFSRPRWESVSASNLSNPNVSPTGKRVLFEYRGEIFSVPKENGTWRNLTNSPGVADRYPIWSPKGDKIAWFSDRSGEYKLVITDQNGLNIQEIALPNPTFYFQPDWSPDGKYIAYTDTHYNIWITNLETKQSSIIATDSYAHPNRSMNPKWSPDSKWVAYAKQQESHFKSIFAYNIDSKKTIRLTDPLADAITPVWDASGKYVYTLASTNYGLQSGWLDMSSYDPEVTRSLYAIVLNAEDKAPVLPKSDEETVEAKTDSDTNKKENDNTSVVVKIDEAGLLDRSIAMTLPDRNYVALLEGPKHTVFVAESVPNTRGLTVHHYDVEKLKATEFASGVSQMVATADRKSVLLNQNNNWHLVDTKSPPKPGEGKLKIDIKTKLDPKAEYKQIFKEGWRFMRDFLYVDNVHGAPW
ncbi:MAG: protease, partial [Winogradskyella sp.]|nr:protease [Winogradskyella sp.]